MSQTPTLLPSQLQHYPATKPPITKPKPPLLPHRPKFLDFKQLKRDHSDLLLKPRHNFVQSPGRTSLVAPAIEATSTQRSSLVIMESVKRAQEHNTAGQRQRDSVTQFNMRQSLGNSSHDGAEPNMASVTSEGFKKQLNHFASKLASSTGYQEKHLICQVSKSDRSHLNHFSSNLPPKSSSPILRQGSKKRKRWEDLYQEDRLKRDRLLRQSSEYESLKKSIELQQCTFQPQIAKLPQKENNNSANKKDLYEKGIIWKREVDQKIKAKQNEKLTQEIATLTFQPTLQALNRDKLLLSPILNIAKQGPKRKILEGSMRAMEQFISRMTRAKIENANKQEQVQLPRNLPKSPVPRKVEVVAKEQQLSKSPSQQQLSFVSTMTPKSNNQSRSPLNLSKFTDVQSKVGDNSNLIRNDVTLCTSLYLQNKYSMKKQQTPTKSITPTKQKPSEMKLQNFERALSKLHLQIQNFNV